MEENKTAQSTQMASSTPPDFVFKQIRLNRASNICYNMAIAACIAIVVAFASGIIAPLLLAFVYLFLFLVMIGIVIFTIGLVFLTPNNPIPKIIELMNKLTGANDAVMKASYYSFKSIKWFAIIGLVTSILGIVFVSLTKRQKKVSKIIVLSVLTLILTVVLIFVLITGGIQWQI